MKKVQLPHLGALLTVFLLTVSMLFIPQRAQSADYTFVSIKGLVEQEVGRIVLTEVYKSMGINIDITPLPGKRAQSEATSGAKDGEIMRIFTYGENNPTVVRVPTAYYSLETMGFVKKGSGVKIGSKEELAKLHAAKVLGVKHTDNITKGMPANQLIDMTSTDKCMMAVLKGRADVCLTNTTDGEIIKKKFGFADIEQIEKPLAVLELFHYPHESKKDLVPKVDAQLKKMMESGELDKIIKSAEATVIDQFAK